MTHAALFTLIVLAAFSHSVMDSITFIRVHTAQMPFADGWHLAQYVRIMSYLGVGYLTPRAWRRDKIATAIVVVCAFIMGRFIWDAVISSPQYWLNYDTLVRISTGWYPLDKLLGFHF